MLIHRITNSPRDYAWGVPGGISAALGWPATSAVEAELWLGSHPGSPSLFAEPTLWPDLLGWEEASGVQLPFLLKILAAAEPLSLQAHPASAQAAAGFARENAHGIPLEAPHRNYKDPFSKPELIVALADGFEALCGFRPVGESLALVDLLFARCDPDAAGPLARLHELLAAPDGLFHAVAWLLAHGPDVDVLVEEVSRQALAFDDLEVARRLAARYPGDPGIAVALLLNHVTLAAGECLWLPAGNVHAYLRGIGVELMGPSDNVLRGGLTPKHVDSAELLQVLDFTGATAPLLAPEILDGKAVAYRPEAAGFQLVLAHGDSAVETGSASIVIVLDGEFVVASGDREITLSRGQAALITEPGRVELRGSGRLALAAGRS